jgi:hypothetical protein
VILAGCVVRIHVSFITRKKLDLFWKARDVHFERSRAPSLESMIPKCSEVFISSDEPTENNR